MSTLTPTSQPQRIHEIDILRGFAIWGIFMVNILVMNCAFTFRFEWEMAQTHWLDQAAMVFQNLFTFSKFFPIFSFLFGLGVALQLQKMKEIGTYTRAFFIRRFFALFIFGVCHILFIWSGDILHLYAIFGFLLLLFFKLPPKTMFITGIFILLFPYFGWVLETLLTTLNINVTEGLAVISKEEVIRLKNEGSYASGIPLRIKEYSFLSIFLYTELGPMSLFMALTGGFVVRTGILTRLPEFLKKMTVPILIVAPLFLAYHIVLIYFIMPNHQFVHGSFISIFLATLYMLSNIVMAFFYLWLFARVFQTNWGKKLLSPLRHLGRMAFTNYIMQSVIAYIFMRTVGWYMQLSASECILFVSVTFIVQVFLSKLWLSKFKFGPLEWLWRCISYWKILPIK